MAETLTLTAPETEPAHTTYSVTGIYLDKVLPQIRVDLVSNQGKPFTWLYTPSATATRAQVMQAIAFVNRGDFVAQGKTLQQWALEQIVALGIKAGTVTT